MPKVKTRKTQAELFNEEDDTSQTSTSIEAPEDEEMLTRHGPGDHQVLKQRRQYSEANKVLKDKKIHFQAPFLLNSDFSMME